MNWKLGLRCFGCNTSLIHSEKKSKWFEVKIPTSNKHQYRTNIHKTGTNNLCLQCFNVSK